MDSNLMNCPTCGHSVNTAAGACAYCGAIVSEEEPNQRSEDNSVPDEPKAAETVSPLTEAETPPTAAISEYSDQVIDSPVADKKPADPEFLQQAPQIPEPADSSQMETAVEPATDSEPLSTATTDEHQSTDKAMNVESDVESSQQFPAASDAAESESKEDVVPESKPQEDLEPAVELMPAKVEPESEIETQPDQPAPEIQEGSQTEAAADVIQVSAEVETLDTSDDKPAESATPAEGIREAADIEDAYQEQAAKTPLETATPAEKTGEVVTTEDEPDINAAADPAMPVESKSETASQVTEETILLDIADEVKMAPVDPMVETAKIESPAVADQPEVEPVDKSAEMQPEAAEILKIEKAARDMAEAVEKQKAAALEAKKAKEQALKKQKAALAKARAQKKHQIIMAKAAALKRKKAAQAKAQALKQQNTDQVAVEHAIMEQDAAAQVSGASGRPKIHRCSKSDNKMQELLEKYKGQSIGINYDFSAEIMAAQLVEANGDFFQRVCRGSTAPLQLSVKDHINRNRGAKRCSYR